MAFYNSINNPSNFSISFMADPFEDFGFFAKGYRLAADSIAENLLEKNHFADYEAYPIMFLYRHSLELHLKNILYRIAKLFHFKGIDAMYAELHNRHELPPLANKAYKVMEIAFPKEQELSEIMKDVKRITNDFAIIDPSSFAYRYPVKTDGTPSTPKNQIVNLEAFAVQMNELLMKLEVINLGMSIEITSAQEIFEELQKV